MTSPTMNTEELVVMLSQTLGESKAREVLDGTLARLRIASRALTIPQALEVLETIAEEPGLVGTTARFAKSRVHLSALAATQKSTG